MVVITNQLRNKSSLIIGTLSLTGGDYLIDSGTTTCAGASLPPGKRCRIGLRFTPSVKGHLLSTLTVSDTSTNGPHLVMLRGMGK
jgi:hypothetical protein